MQLKLHLHITFSPPISIALGLREGDARGSSSCLPSPPFKAHSLSMLARGGGQRCLQFNWPLWFLSHWRLASQGDTTCRHPHMIGVQIPALKESLWEPLLGLLGLCPAHSLTPEMYLWSYPCHRPPPPTSTVIGPFRSTVATHSQIPCPPEKVPLSDTNPATSHCVFWA